MNVNTYSQGLLASHSSVLQEPWAHCCHLANTKFKTLTVFIPQGPTWLRVYLKLTNALAWSWETYYMKNLLLKELHKIRVALESTNGGNKVSVSIKSLFCIIDGLQAKVNQAKNGNMHVCSNALRICTRATSNGLKLVPTTVMFMLSAFATVSMYEDTIPGPSQTFSNDKLNKEGFCR